MQDYNILCRENGGESWQGTGDSSSTYAPTNFASTPAPTTTSTPASITTSTPTTTSTTTPAPLLHLPPAEQQRQVPSNRDPLSGYQQYRLRTQVHTAFRGGQYSWSI